MPLYRSTIVQGTAQQHATFAPAPLPVGGPNAEALADEVVDSHTREITATVATLFRRNTPTEIFVSVRV